MASNLKLESFSDRELLHLISDLAEEDGWVDVETIATRVGLTVDGMSEEQLLIHARRCVSVRLAWIRKLSGCVERHLDAGLLWWRLTDTGRQVVNAKMTDALASRLDSMEEFASLAALDALSRRYRRADVKAANLMRREWVYGTHRSRR